jgi:hypothetical protein
MYTREETLFWLVLFLTVLCAVLAALSWFEERFAEALTRYYRAAKEIGRDVWALLSWESIMTETHFMYSGDERSAGRGWWVDYFILSLFYHARQVARYLRCALGSGHRMVDDSAIGPESGTEAHYCERCGKSWSHTFY